MEEPGGQPENRIKAPKKAEAQTIFQKQQQEIRQLKQQLAALKSDHARSAGQSSLDGLKNGLGQMLFKVTGNAGRNSAGKRSEAMRQWDADSYSEERTQWGYAENPSRAEKTQGQADDYREKSQEIVKTDYASQKNDTAVTEQGAPAAGQNMTVTAAVHPASDTISDVALDTTSDTVPAPTAPDENNLTDTVNKTTGDAIAEAAKPRGHAGDTGSQNCRIRRMRMYSKSSRKKILIIKSM